MLKIFARFLLKLLGWETDDNLPPQKKFVVVGAPHTTNWDFFYFLLYVWKSGFKIRWGAKHTLFKSIAGPILKKLGGIPINRGIRSNFIDRMIEEFKKHDEFFLILTPEGTRSKSDYWKTGFYYIALGAEAPIALGYIHYPKKIIGVAKTFMPSGDIKSDMKLLKEFYKDKVGKYPAKQGEIILK